MAYDAGSIVVLPGLLGVRRRPAMYVGSVDVDGFHHLVWEVLDNSIDEAVAGYCGRVIVKVDEKTSEVSVQDDGRGIPVEKHPTEGIPTVDVVMTILHAGGKFDKKSYATSGGLHGVGASVVNALSEWMEVTVWKDGKAFRRLYKASLPTEKELQVFKSKNTGTGTRVRFKPDLNLFKGCHFERARIVRRLRELAFLNKGLSIKLFWTDRDGEETSEAFHSEEGLPEYVRYLLNGRTALHEVFTVSGKVEDCEVLVSFVYDEGYSYSGHSFANNIATPEGGVHMNAALDSLCKVIDEIADKANLLKDVKLTSIKSDVMEGLNLVVSILVPEPQFGGQTKTRLGNQELRWPLGEWMIEEFRQVMTRNRKVGNMIAAKIVDAMKTRDAARKAKDLSRKKSTISSMGLPGKLVDCACRKPELCELYLVEGDSAGGCLSSDAMVRTADGNRRIADLQVDDMVMTHDGTYRRVRHVWTTRKRKKCQLKAGGSMLPACSHDHPWLVQRNGGLEWVKAEDIREGDLLAQL